VHAEVGVGVEEARQDPGARRVDQLGVLRDVDVGLGADRDDPAAVDEDRAAVDGITVDGDDVAPDNCLRHSSPR
jgi:hypothetical protein